MLSVVKRHSRCVCQCVLQSGIPAVNVQPNREAHHPSTQVFKRKHELGLVKVGKYPLIKRRNTILEKLPEDPAYKKTMQCILTKEIEGIGLKGTVVEVTKRLFRNQLYPNGAAVYASPENLAYYESYRKASEEEGIDYHTKQMMKRLAGFHLRVFMNPNIKWELSLQHIKVACRKQGLWVEEENIVPPAVPVVQPGEFTFKLQVPNRIAAQVRGTIYPIEPDGRAKITSQMSPEWDNPPIDPDNVVEFLKKTGIAEDITDEPDNK